MLEAFDFIFKVCFFPHKLLGAGGIIPQRGILRKRIKLFQSYFGIFVVKPTSAKV